MTAACDLQSRVWEELGTMDGPYFHSVALMGFFVVLTFVASTLTQNYSQTDKLWSITPALFAWVPLLSMDDSTITNSLLDDDNQRLILMAVLITIWSVRLTYNFSRHGGYTWPPWEGEEDYRWAVLQAGGSTPLLKNRIVWALFNLGFISFYQNLLLWWIAAPSLVVYTLQTGCGGTDTETTVAHPLNAVDGVATILFLVFLVLESIGDDQQQTFQTEKYRRLRLSDKDDDDKKTTTTTTTKTLLVGEYADGFCQTGMFAIVRKPNYAAEQAIWASYYLFVVAACPSQWCNWSLLGSIQLILLFQQSGPFTERISSSKYPKYKEYQKRVPLYIPSIKTFSSLFVATNETDRDGNQGGDSNSDKKQS